MDIVVSPSKLNKVIDAPPSKSMFHRLIICSALANGTSEIKPLPDSEDILATISAVKSLGAEVEYTKNSILITGIEKALSFKHPIPIHCSESGSTLRFMIPIAAALGIPASFSGEGRLPLRPMDTYVPVLESHSVKTRYSGTLPFNISGRLKSGEYEIPADISSQFITGLLFALPLLDGDSKIILTTKAQSASYIELTLNVLKKFGIVIEKTDYGFFVKGNQKYTSQNCVCEGDWSNAAFFLCVGAMKSPVTVRGLDLNSSQGDKKIIDILKRFNAKCFYGKDEITVSPPKEKLVGIDVDAADIPDIIPVICAVAACAEGKTHIYNASRLRIKESDRIETTEHVLNSMGIKTESTDDTLTVYGTGGRLIHGGKINSFNDHRIAMTAAIMALCADSSTLITGAECVKKSFPDFFTRFTDAGGVANVIHMGQKL